MSTIGSHAPRVGVGGICYTHEEMPRRRKERVAEALVVPLRGAMHGGQVVEIRSLKGGLPRLKGEKLEHSSKELQSYFGCGL